MCQRKLIEIVQRWQMDGGSPYELAAMIAEAQREHCAALLRAKGDLPVEDLAQAIERDEDPGCCEEVID